MPPWRTSSALHRSEADVPFAGEGGDAVEVRRDVTWVGFSGIARWDASEKVSLALRGEVFDDADGARRAPP
ncbi:MAG: outer membrane beta-barrel protein [Deltaproteobacteria bacterium]|jgi:hypothetical protein|nr:outer membrane beta-barrel protein [Deltaproteobacteria bacterium]